MYGTLKAALMYYRKISKDLREYRFVINPCDPCVEEKKGQAKDSIPWCGMSTT